MTDMMFYVLYSPVKEKYLDEAGYLVAFDKAEKFDNSTDKLATTALKDARILAGNDIRFVGPCKEGEAP